MPRIVDQNPATRQLLQKLASGFLIFAAPWVMAAEVYIPAKWTKFIPVTGQSEPVPEQWLQDPEARIANNLILPEGVPKTVPFDFGNGLRASNSTRQRFNLGVTCQPWQEERSVMSCGKRWSHCCPCGKPQSKAGDGARWTTALP